MAHVICDPCIGVKDTACTNICPVDGIHPTRAEQDFRCEKQLYVDPDACIDCGICVDNCPVLAIFPESEVPPQWYGSIAINAAYYQNPHPPCPPDGISLA